MSGKREIARLNARIKELEAELAAKKKVGDAYAEVVLGHPTPGRRSDFEDTVAAGHVESLPEYEARACRHGVDVAAASQKVAEPTPPRADVT